MVKNVAGYDFCKLLTGSLGTLGVITQVTLKIKPLPERSAFVACDVPDFATAERLLAALVNSQTTPAAIELLAGPALERRCRARARAPRHASRGWPSAWKARAAEVDWMVEQLAARVARRWASRRSRSIRRRAGRRALAAADASFPPTADAPLVLKASVLPSAVVRLLPTACCEIDPQAARSRPTPATAS